MGLLAGSTVFLVTLLWGTCVIVGKCDIGPDGLAIDSTNTKGFSLTGKLSSCTYDVATLFSRISGNESYLEILQSHTQVFISKSKKNQQVNY
jgi:hypothetical protein